MTAIFVIGTTGKLVSLIVELMLYRQTSQTYILIIIIIIYASIIFRHRRAARYRTGFLIVHFSLTLISAIAALQIQRDGCLGKIQAPTAFHRIMIAVSRTRPDGMRGSGLIAHHRHLLLVEITLAQPVCPLSADVPTGTLMLLCQQEIDMAGKPRTSREIHHPAQSPLGMLLRDNINDTHVAFRIMLGGRCRDNLYILYMPGRDLLQSLCTREDTRLTIYVNQKAAASTKSNIAFRIYPYGRRIL